MEKNTTRLVQLKNASVRCIALVKEPKLQIIDKFDSVYKLALEAIDTGSPITKLIEENLSDKTLDYDEIYEGKSEWKLLPAFDHPTNISECVISGTGLTHKNSAANRQAMHETADQKPTDSMIVYWWGVDGGIADGDKPGIQPEWFYKGNGSALKGHGDHLEVPAYGNDGGEEPEIAGAYIIDRNGNPYRIGFTTGNEFSDHVMEKKNYLYLAPSKLRQNAIGPELVITEEFSDLTGYVKVIRKGETLWDAENIKTGEAAMAHNLANLEYHQFKYEGHRVPLQAHVHYFGTGQFSFGKGIRLQDGDEMLVQWDGMGRALKNYLKEVGKEEKLVPVKAL
jgi:hypothetical protein